MNLHHNPNQNAATASAAPQVNPAVNQQMSNGNNVGGLVYPNSNMPFVAPPNFMNFPNQPFLLQNVQFPNGFVGFNPQQNFGNFPVNQFNPAQQQQQGQFFARGPMVPPAYNQNVGLPPEQVLLQNTIQNIYQLLQLQNSNNAQQCPPGNFPMIQNQIPNVMGQQNLGFRPNQQFAMPNCNGPVQPVNQLQQNMGPQLQGNPFLPGGTGSVQAQQPQNVLATLTNFPNQIIQGVGPPNQMFPMPNSNGPVQHITQGQQNFVSPMTNGNAPKPAVNFGQTHNSPNFQHNHGNKPIIGSGSPKGFKSHKHAKEKFGNYNGNLNKEGNSTAAVNHAKFKKKVPSLNYTEHEIKQWRELRKKNYPSTDNVLKKCKKESDFIDQEATLRRQQLKEILAKQAELGCEVADIPPSYLFDSDKQNPRDKKHNREQFKKGKFQNKRGTRFQENRNAKRARPGDQDSFNANNNQNRAAAPKPNEREPSLLKKLLSRDIKRDKNYLLQVFRFMAVNSFFNGDGDSSLKFPSVIVKETNNDVVEETTCLGLKGSEMAEEDETNNDVAEETTCSVSKGGKKDEEDEEGEITD